MRRMRLPTCVNTKGCIVYIGRHRSLTPMVNNRNEDVACVFVMSAGAAILLESHPPWYLMNVNETLDQPSGYVLPLRLACSFSCLPLGRNATVYLTDAGSCPKDLSRYLTSA